MHTYIITDVKTNKEIFNGLTQGKPFYYKELAEVSIDITLMTLKSVYPENEYSVERIEVEEEEEDSLEKEESI